MFDIFGAVSSAVSSISRTISSAVSSFTRSVSSGITSARRTISSGVSNISRTISRSISHASRSISSGISHVSRSISGGVSHVSRTISSGATAATRTIQQIRLPPIKPKLPPIKPQLPSIKPSSVSQAANVVVRKVSEAASSIKPKVVVPQIKLPEIKPQVKLSTIKLPEVKLPEIKPQVVIPQIRLPEVKVQTPQIKLPEIKIPQASQIKLPEIAESARKTVAQVVEKRDEIYERGTLTQKLGAMAADVMLPLDLAKVITKGADEPMDYVWAGVDVLGLIPFVGWAAKGAIKGVSKSLKVASVAAKVGKLGEVSKASKIADFGKVGKEVGDLSLFKGVGSILEGFKGVKIGEGVEALKARRLSRFTKLELPKIRRLELPKIKRFELPKIKRFELPKIRRLELPKIKKFEPPKIKPLSRMRPARAFKVADEIPEVAKMAGKTAEIGKTTKLSRVGKALKYAPHAALGGALVYGLLNAPVPEEEQGGGDQGGGDRRDQGIDQSIADQIAQYFQELANWLASLFGVQPPYMEGYEYPYYYGEGEYPYPYYPEYPYYEEPLPPEYGYEEEYPPSYVPEEWADYVAPAEGFAQDVLGAIEGIPLIGDLAAEARRSGMALPFLLVGAVGAYAGYKYGYPRVKKFLRKHGILGKKKKRGG